MDSEILLTKINDYLARYRLFVEQENRANRYNINIRAETFFIPILRVLFKCPHLENVNIEKNNTPGIDLGDRKKRIAIQVTSEKTSKKVVDSLSKFLDNKFYETFDRLIIFIIQDRQRTYSDSRIPYFVQQIKEKNQSFCFEIKKDIVDLAWISKEITSMQVDQLIEILHIFMLEVEGDFVSPLSKYPSVSRLYDDIDLFSDNRKELFQEIIQRVDDILLVGPPGIGKTFILQKVAQEKKAYFVSNESNYDLARAIGFIRPEIIFIDDAHRKSELLGKVCHLRNRIDWNFRIIATSWPAEHLTCAKHKGPFYNSQIIEMMLFTRDEVADLIAYLLKKENLSRNYYLEQSIVEYANGLPGLAVILLDNCLKTGGREVFEGESILTFLTNISLETQSFTEWRKTKKVLAYISLFGGQGANLSSISRITETPKLTLESLLESIKYCGNILIEVGRFRVHPRALRAVLVKEEFFRQDNPRVEEFDRVINLEDFSEETIGIVLESVFRGGFIQRDYLYQLMSETQNEELWEKFFWLFPEMIENGISDYPKMINASVLPGLANNPTIILPIIFQIASKDKRLLHSHPNHVLRKLEHWIHKDPHSVENIEKRKLVIQALKMYNNVKGDPETILNVINIVLSPVYEINKLVPGSGNTLSYVRGLLPIDLLRHFSELWDQILPLLSEVPIQYLNKVIDTLYDWIYPSRILQEVSEEYVNDMREIAESFILGFGNLVRNHPALFSEVKQLYRVLRKELEIESELTTFQLQMFYALFPPKDDYIKNISDKERYSVEGLAQELLEMDKDEVLDHVMWAWEEANLMPNPWPNFIGNLLSNIAQQVENPLLWVESMQELGLDEYIFPFIYKAVDNQVLGWEETVQELLDNEKTSSVAIQLVLGLENAPSHLIDNVVDQISSDNSEFIKKLITQDKVSVVNIQRLLNHDSEKIRSAAAIGEWLRTPKNQIRECLQDDWECVISDVREFDYQLIDIFKEYKQYALGWVVDAYFSICNKWSQEKLKSFQDIIPILDVGNREQLIDVILEQNLQDIHEIELIKSIVGDSVSLYKYILNNCDFNNQRFYLLASLNRIPDERVWPEMALLASEKGIPVREIIRAVLQPAFFIVRMGPESKIYEEFIDAFNKLSKNENRSLRDIANQGLIKAREIYDQCLRREMNQDIYGWER